MTGSAAGPRAGAGRGLYVHVPFCRVKCFYCGFTAFSGQSRSVGRYLGAVGAEARLRAAAVRTLYVGGGTPSELSAGELDRLYGCLEEAFGPLAGLAESTLEANPESAAPAKLEALRRRGVGRLSLGLQAAEPRLLSLLGRRHSAGDFVRAFKEAKALGFSLNVDLMYGLPTQTLDDLGRSLGLVLDLGPDHVSLYGLQVEERTLFARRGVEVDEDLSRDLFEAGLDALSAAGYRHYEISNFARPGRESVHNTNYWLGGEYVGLGCGASGHLAGRRYSNHDRLDAYCAALERGGDPAAQSEALAGREKLGERLMLGLRLLDGVAVTPEVSAGFGAELDALAGQGLLALSGGRARLTREGVFLANRVFEAFVAPF